MGRIERFIMDRNNHRDNNCVIVTIMCHDDGNGQLYDVDHRLAWNIEMFIDQLSKVETLVRKPKILIIRSFRQSEHFKYFEFLEKVCNINHWICIFIEKIKVSAFLEQEEIYNPRFYTSKSALCNGLHFCSGCRTRS